MILIDVLVFQNKFLLGYICFNCKNVLNVINHLIVTKVLWEINNSRIKIVQKPKLGFR